MVVTIEPGIYVRAADDIPKAFRDIGIRIEDDALLTAGGCELITAGVPKAADDIEALMAEAKGRETPVAGGRRPGTSSAVARKAEVASGSADAGSGSSTQRRLQKART